MGDRIVTWPNALSAARLLGVPVFLWLVLVPRTTTADLIAAGILATIIALAVRGIIPWWLFGALAGRELIVGVALLVLHYRTVYGALQVSFVGKTATLCLMYAFPLLFIGAHSGTVAEVVRVVGWAFAIWGTALYWWAAMLYLTQVRDLVKESGVEGAAAS